MEDNKLIKSLELLSKGKKADPVGTVRNGRKKVAEGKWVLVSQGKESAAKPQDAEKTKSKADYNVQEHQNQANVHFDEAVKYNQLLDQMKDKVAQRKKVNPNYQIPQKAQEYMNEVKAKVDLHSKSFKQHNSEGTQKWKDKVKKSDIEELTNFLRKGDESSFYVGLVVMNKFGQILLGKRIEDGIWTGPGGGSDPGENPMETAKREAFEEAGLDLNNCIIKELPTLEAGNKKPVFCYLVHTPGTHTLVELDPDNEVKKWDWYWPTEIPKDAKKDENRYKNILNAIMKFKGIKKSLSELNEYLAKGKAMPIGTVRTWGKNQFVKRAEGWVYADGPHKGKKMGSIGRGKGKAVSSKLQTGLKKEPVDLEAAAAGFKEKAKQLKDENKKKAEQRKAKKPQLPKEGKVAATSFLDATLKAKGSDRLVKYRGVATGKPSKVVYKSPEGIDTNLVGTVSFGKSSMVVQKELNQFLFQSEIVIDSLGIKMKKPVDFVCQNISTAKRTQATFMGLKDKYESNDRIDIKDRTSGMQKSLIHEIGHAIDYSLTSPEEKKLSFFDKLSRNDHPNKKDYERLKELLKEAPFYQDRSDKRYLADPTEIFARCFEVYAYDKALKLRAEGKLDNNFVDSFNPDFLKSKASMEAGNLSGQKLVDVLKTSNKDKESEELSKLLKENDDQIARFKELKSEMTKLVLEEMRDKSKEPKVTEERNAKMAAIKKEGSEITTKNKKGLKELNSKASQFRKLLKEEAGHREDADKVREEISSIMAKILSNNEIKKALNNLDLYKSEIAMDDQGSAIETANYSKDVDEAETALIKEFQDLMSNFGYGDTPREKLLGHGYSIIMSKVDDGLYSGFIRQTTEEGLEETVGKVEKQTIPTIIQYLKAKEYLKVVEPEELSVELEVAPQEVAELNQALEPTPVPVVSNGKEIALKLIDLLDRLV